MVKNTDFKRKTKNGIHKHVKNKRLES